MWWCYALLLAFFAVLTAVFAKVGIKVAPVDKLSVAPAIIISVLFVGEVLTWKTSVGAPLIMAGTLVLIL